MQVDVVLLNWNSGAFTIHCINSLRAGTKIPERIVVVDNASTDNSADTISRQFPEVKLIRNDKNLGFTGGNNIGIRIFLKERIDYIWLLNNDTEVDRHCLEYLLNEFAKDPTVSATTGKILYPPPDKNIWYAGATFNYWTLRTYDRGALEKDEGQYDEAEDVPFISGCCMMVRRNAFEKIGLLDQNFFAYSEDFDWCLRALKSGLRLRYVPNAVLYHRVSASIQKNRGKISGGTTSLLSVYVNTRNRIFIIRKHASNINQFATAMIASVWWFLYYALALFILFRWDKLQSLFRGVKDGLFTRLHYPKYL